jgi:hypothetical protein
MYKIKIVIIIIVIELREMFKNRGVAAMIG